MFAVVGLGAALGAVARFALTNYGKKHWMRQTDLPLPTLAWVHFAASVHQFVAGVRVCNVPLRKCLDLARRGRAECVPMV